MVYAYSFMLNISISLSFLKHMKTTENLGLHDQYVFHPAFLGRKQKWQKVLCCGIKRREFYILFTYITTINYTYHNYTLYITVLEFDNSWSYDRFKILLNRGSV